MNGVLFNHSWYAKNNADQLIEHLLGEGYSVRVYTDVLRPDRRHSCQLINDTLSVCGTRTGASLWECLSQAVLDLVPTKKEAAK